MSAEWKMGHDPGTSNTVPVPTGPRRTEGPGDTVVVRRQVRRLAVPAGVLAYAWWATGVRPFSGTATLAVVGAGLAAMTTGHARRPQHHPRRPLAGAAGWLALLGALAGWQFLAYVQEPRSEHPTLSALTNAALDTHAGRALAFAVWLIAGCRLAR